MSGTPDKLTLKPGEKRLLVVIGLTIFVVLNLWFVWPRFGDWGRVRAEIDRHQRDLQRYQGEIARKPEYQQRLQELEGQGVQVLEEAQALTLQNTIQSQALRSGVTISRYDPLTRTVSRTNQFFDEQVGVITLLTGDQELVNFLVNLADSDSMIRVRSMSLRPDANRQKLQGNLTLVASYQKGVKPRPPAGPAANDGDSQP